jgi:hypothetical protein
MIDGVVDVVFGKYKIDRTLVWWRWFLGRYGRIRRKKSIANSLNAGSSRGRLSGAMLSYLGDGEFVYDSTECMYAEVW